MNFLRSKPACRRAGCRNQYGSEVPNDTISYFYIQFTIFVCSLPMILCAAALPGELNVAKSLRAKRKRHYVCTGLGNTQTIFTLTKYLAEHADVEEVLFVGVCGWLGNKHDLIQVGNVINAHTGKEIILPLTKHIAPLVTMLSSDVPIHDITLMQGYSYVDMESRGVAFVTEKWGLPCTILRVPFDEIGRGDCATFDRAGALEQMKHVLQGSSV